MTSCDDFIERAKNELPDLCNTKDLVKFGIYKSGQAAHNARKKGLAADHFRLPHGTIVYPKKGIIELLEKSKHSHNEKPHENNNSGKSYPKGQGKSHTQGLRL